MLKQFDVVIVGAGIIGLAHAVCAVRAGLSVAVFERGTAAQGASVRNFGMLAMIAQASDQQLSSARLALADWQQIAREAGVNLRPAGCLFLARAPEEMAVLEEFSIARKEVDASVALLSPAQLHDHAAALQSRSFLGGLWSADAWKVDQRQALRRISDWLQRVHGVTFHFSATVHGAQAGIVETSVGNFRAGHTILCGGDEFETLFPDSFRASDVGRCRLQMLRTVPQPEAWRLAPFILGGLSIARYSAFAACPSLPALKAYQQDRFAAYLRHGIHVIACQEADGSITIGDSHHYDVARDAERSAEVDQLLLAGLSDMIDLPNPRIAERWLGHYALPARRQDPGAASRTRCDRCHRDERPGHDPWLLRRP